METVMTKPTLRSTDRLTQTVAALARLLDQTMNDIQALDAEFQGRLEAAQEDRATTEQQGAERLKLALEESQLSARELERMREAAGAWEAEKEVLQAECNRARQIAEEIKREHDVAIAETDEAASIALERQIAGAVERVRAELTAQFEADRATLVAERNRAQQRLADVAAEYEARLAETLKQQAASPAPEPPRAQSVELQTVLTEITRVENAIHAISQIVENPESELSVVIRKNVERAELESFLRGLRFRLAGA
jgi:hypothetical protein